MKRVIIILNLTIILVCGALPSRCLASPEGVAAVASATLINRTQTTSDTRCRELFVTAYDSLGFVSPEAIRAHDYLFCGRYYLAWIDNTGFPGEINALWQLDGADSDALDFVYGPDGLVRNMFIAGEHRDGEWPDGYSGSHHLEILSHNSEANDLDICDDTEIPFRPACNGYGVNEAGLVTRDGIPAWTSCSQKQPKLSFTAQFSPMISQDFGGPQKENLRLIYESLLTKEADFDGTYDCDDEHSNWLFPGTFGPGQLFIQRGWELFGTDKRLTKTFQVRNPSGNPAPGGEAVVIHGLITTTLDNPPPGKEFRNWVMPYTNHSTADQMLNCPAREYSAGVFNHNGQYPICDAAPGLSEEYTSGPNRLWVVSSVNGAQRGRTLSTYHTNPYENQPLYDGVERSSQFCECKASNGFELNGGTVGGPFFNTSFVGVPGGQSTLKHSYHLFLATQSCRHSGRMTLTGTSDLGPDNRITIKVSVDAPSTALTDSPLMNGAWLSIKAANGTQLRKVRIPPGAFNPSTGRGWKLVRSGTTFAVWRYRATSQNAIDGVEKLVINVHHGKLSFTVKIKGGGYFVPSQTTPLRVQLVQHDTPAAREAACSEVTLKNCRSGTDWILCQRAAGDLQ